MSNENKFTLNDLVEAAGFSKPFVADRIFIGNKHPLPAYNRAASSDSGSFKMAQMEAFAAMFGLTIDQLYRAEIQEQFKAQSFWLTSRGDYTVAIQTQSGQIVISFAGKTIYNDAFAPGEYALEYYVDVIDDIIKEQNLNLLNSDENE